MKNRKKGLHRAAAFLLAAVLMGNSVGVSVFAQNIGTEMVVQSELGMRNELDSELQAESEEQTKEVSAESEEQTTEVSTESEEQTTEVSTESEKQTTEVSTESEKQTTEVSTESEEQTVEASTESEKQTTEVSTESKKQTTEVSTESEKQTKEVSTESEEQTKEVSTESEKQTTEVSTEKERQEASERVQMKSAVARAGEPSISSDWFVSGSELISFDTNDNTPNEAKKVYFGQNGSGSPQEWWIVGQDPGADGGLVLFAASSFGYSAFNTRQNNYYNGQEVYINHYGASELREKLQNFSVNENYFSKEEQDRMLKTTVYTNDPKYGNTYGISDTLYAAYGGRRYDRYITVGTNRSDSLNGGLRIDASYWVKGGQCWLRAPRTPAEINSDVLMASMAGDIQSNAAAAGSGSSMIVVPAFQLSLSSTLFASAAQAASSGVSGGKLTTNAQTLTLRYDAGDTIGNAVIDRVTGKIQVTNAVDGTFLVVQNSKGAYAKSVTGNTEVSVSDFTINGNPLDTFGDCKVWMEQTDNASRITKAVFAKEVDTAVASVTVGENKKWFASLEEAWAYAKEQSSADTAATVTLEKDISISNPLTVEEGDAIILSGGKDDHILTGNVNGINFLTVKGGSLNLIGGKVQNNVNGHNTIVVESGNFVLDGGIVEGKSIRHSSILVEKSGTAKILSGRVKGYYGVALQQGATGELTLFGGTIENFPNQTESFTILIRIDRSIKSLLGDGKAYYRGEDTKGELVSAEEELNGVSLTGLLTVGDCTHNVEDWTDAGDGTHTGICSICGRDVTEPHRMENGDSTDIINCSSCNYTGKAVTKVKTGEKTVLFSSFEDSWAYAKEQSSADVAATITLLADVNTSEPMTVDVGDTIILSSGEGNYTLTGNVEEKEDFIIVSGGSLELRGGTVQNNGKAANVIKISKGKFVLDGGSVEGRSNQNSGILVESDGTAEILSGKVKAYYGVAIQSGTIGKLTIYGGTIEGFSNDTGSSTILILNNQTIKSLLGEGKAYYRGEDTEGVLITEGLNETKLSGAVMVTVGDCTHSYGEYSYDEETHKRVCMACGNVETGEHMIEEWIDQGDGTHKGNCLSCGTITAGHRFYEDQSKCQDCNAVVVPTVRVEIKGEVTQLFASIEHAWSYAKKHSSNDKIATVTLLKDVSTSESFTVEEGNTIILSSDGGSHTFTGNAEKKDLITVTGGSLTMTGGTIKNDEKGHNVIKVSKGSFILDGGTVEGMSSKNSGVLVEESGTIKILSGRVKAYYGVAVQSGTIGKLTIYGGTIEGFPDETDSYTILILNSQTIKSLLGEGKGYYQGTDTTGEVITEGLDGKKLAGTVTVTVGDCKHNVESWSDVGDGTHKGSCSVCESEVKVVHSLDEDGVCIDCGYQGTVYSVSVIWGELSFSYDEGTWNPEEHRYDGEGWKSDAEDGDRITVTNEGASEVEVHVMYDTVEKAVTGTVTDGNGETLSAPVSLMPEGEEKFRLILTGKPETEMNGQPIGTVTVKLGGE